MDVDLLIVGAGPTGCVVAEQAARVLGWRCLVVDRRPHIAGNCYDRLHESGVLIHQYGPHYFRTNNPDLVQYLSQYTEFHEAPYIVKAQLGPRLLPFPINLTTLEDFFGLEGLTSERAAALLEEKREAIPNPTNSEEYVLSRVGRELYEAFYVGYTMKQWGRHPRALDPSVCGRIPVRLNRDDRYVDHTYQIMPSQGFTQMFAAMLDHPLIEVRLGVDFKDVDVRPRRATVYTGPVDEYFGHRLGPLPWRSLSFSFEAYGQEWVQPCVQINHPNEYSFTRSVEIKHVTRQQHPCTVVSRETSGPTGEPYYPVPSPSSRALYGAYRRLCDAETQERRVIFAGRLAEYRYMNMDEAMEGALNLMKRLRGLS